MVKRYRKKPVEIEAIQFTGDNYEEVAEWMGKSEKDVGLTNCGIQNFVSIFTLEGTMIANAGDYIVKGVKGEFYPCKPDIFIQTYEET